MTKLYLSTAIPYVNAAPHLGFGLELAQADVIARFHRAKGDEVFFLSGTDEFSISNVKAAEKAGIEVGEFVAQNARRFCELKNILNISLDDFIRTTESRHIAGAQKLWLAVQKDIYKKRYRGLYCASCEEFYKERELVNGLCPEHKTKPEVVEEENYFFALVKYAPQIKALIWQNKLQIIPESRRREILSFIDAGIEDIAVSRSVERAKGWGIDVPGDTSQKLWVWIDALSNYINALGYGEGSQKFEEWWQQNNNKLHIIGKGILRFHALYWPAFLLSAGLALPERIFVHGYITVAGQKISKTLGNVVDPFVLVQKYGADALRYFLLREIAPAEDGDFTIAKFEERYNADLANGLGNLVSRISALIKFGEKINPKIVFFDQDKKEKIYRRALENFQFNRALEFIWDLITQLDQKIDQEKPWTLSQVKLKKTLAELLGSLVYLVQFLKPFLPESSKKISEIINQAKLGKLKREPPLFPKK